MDMRLFFWFLIRRLMLLQDVLQSLVVHDHVIDFISAP